MFGVPRFFGQDKIREILHRFGPRDGKKGRLAAERPMSEWRREGEKRQAQEEEDREAEND